MADLPKDTIYNIFSRIPIKSLARFRCVCKQWLEHINDPYLANIHVVKDEPKPLHIAQMKRCIHPFQQSPFFVQMSILRIIMEDTIAGIQVIKKDLSPRFLVKRSSIYVHDTIQGYCNGLITLIMQHDIHNRGTTFVVINPLTKECHELPPMKHCKLGQGLGYDNSTNTFKMVCVFLNEHYLTGVNIGAVVHVLGTDTWREIPSLSFYQIAGEAVYANGHLYWFGYTTSFNVVYQLVWLDMKTEEFGVIDLPKQREKGWSVDKLVDLNGELGFVYGIKGSDSKVVWILKHQEWMIHCVIDGSKSDYYGWIVLGCWNKNGDILMTSPRGLMYVYRLESDSFDRLIGPVADPGEERIAEVRMYQSSLLSIRKWH